MIRRMMQLLLAAFLVLSASAELRKSLRITGQSNHPVPKATNGAGARHLQDCEVIGWAELCERKKLTAGSCFQLKPSVEAAFCELLSGARSEAPVQLRPAVPGILTLTSGELRITGQFQMTSLRLVAKSVKLADAHVEAWHASENSTAPGGSFYSKGSSTLTRSRLTVRDAGVDTMNGGGFAAEGDLSVRQHSEVVIKNVAGKYGAGFFAGNVYISENSKILIQNSRCSKNGGAFQTDGRVQVSNNSVLSLQNVSAEDHGGGFVALGEVEIAGNSTVNISNSHAARGKGGGFDVGQDVKVSSGSRLIIRNATAESAGGFGANGKTLIINSSTVSIQNAMTRLLGGGFIAGEEVVIDGMSSVHISHSRSEYAGGFRTGKGLQVTNGSVLSLENVTAGINAGGFLAFEEVEIAGNSTINISNSRAELGGGGGFDADQDLNVSSGSRVIVRNATAGKSGGGFFVSGRTLITHSTVSIQSATAPLFGAGFYSGQEVVIDGMSSVRISNARSEGNGAGLATDKWLQLSNSSMLSIQNVTTGQSGGGFVANGVKIAGNSTVNISNSHAGTEQSGDGGGFVTSKGLQVSSGSKLIIRNATAESAGGFAAVGRILIINGSTVSIQHATSRQHGGGFCAGDVVIDGMSSVRISDARSGVLGGGFQTGRRLQVSNNSVLSLENVETRNNGGGFVAQREVEIAGNSTVNVSNSHAETGRGGGFDVGQDVKVSSGSRLILWNATAGQSGGGFVANGRTLIINRSTVSIQHATSRQYGGGFFADHKVVIDGMSSVHISHSRAEHGGGFQTDFRVQVSNNSVLSLQNVTTGRNAGGFVALGEVEIAGNSTVNISNSHAARGKAGGFDVGQDVKVSSGSRLIIRNATAGQSGGGFVANGRTLIINRSTVSIQHAMSRHYGGGFAAGEEVVIDGMSSVHISHSRAEHGGGFQTDFRVQVSNNSVLSLQNVTSGNNGGGFVAQGEVEIAGNSTVNISNSQAESGDGGGFHTGSGLDVSSGSRVILRNATAGKSGGGFFAKGRTFISHSRVSIRNATARLHGAGFCAEGVADINASSVAMLSSHAGADGGAFSVLGLTLHRSSISIGNSTSLGSGSGGRVDGQVLLSSSSLVVKQAQGHGNSSVLVASCLHLRDRSRLLFEDVVSGRGVELQNSGCSSSCSNSTFHVAADAVLNASGRFSSGLLSIAACPKEKVRLSGIHLQSWSSALLSTQGTQGTQGTQPSSVVVDHVTIDYEPPIHNLQVLAAKDGFEIVSLTVSCQNCDWGITFNATKDGKQLRTVSSERLDCAKTATVSKGKTRRCKCSGQQIAAKNWPELVPLEKTFETCTFCKPQFHFRNGDCQKCGIFNAWSDGRTDVCHVLPRKKMERITLSSGAAVMVLLTFIAFEILQAPLVIIDAKSDLADPTQAESKRTFTLSVQGPIVDLRNSLSRLVHWWVRYRAKGTGLRWLDYDHKKTKAVKVHNIGHRRLLLRNTNPTFDCASCKGSLHAAGFLNLLGLLTGLISVTAMLPAIIQVVVTSGNGVEHVFVTAILLTLPMVAAAALLHFPVAWLIHRLYRRTPISRALDEYRKQIKCKPLVGPDASHPHNQGLQVLTLGGLWKHFESFILERDMHFVVANIVMPLTQSKGISFVTLWGGRQVDYFVSHCWGGSFPHLVHSIECHALSKEGNASWFAAYWICSFANNQWNIEDAVGSDPMESAFALTLTSGIKGVAMVLDREVQPLTRVWCLFEYFLSSREHLELVFVTNAGVIGDDGCSSFDIALEVGKKIKSLQVAKCEASSDKDKKDIFEYIISELGSLERMDKQIRALMSDMLMRNLANVERATESLVESLGERSAETVHVTVDSF